MSEIDIIILINFTILKKLLLPTSLIFNNQIIFSSKFTTANFTSCLSPQSPIILDFEGHSLGLSHSDVRSAIMAPFYRGWDPNLKLARDDIDAIQALYGADEVRTCRNEGFF